MTFEQFLQLLGVLGGIIASAVSARWGHKAILDRLQSYVTVTEYREGKAALHNEINALKVENAGLKRDIAHLLERK